MSEYVLPHQLRGERYRLDLMSALLDPVVRGHFDQLGMGDVWQCLEFDCCNGSISRALLEYVALAGHVVASDIDIRYIEDLQAPCLEVQRIDLLNDPIEQGAYDFVVARALLHHLAPARKGLERWWKR